MAIRNGAAGRLVVEPGDRVRATGSFVQFPDGNWLDLAQVVTLVRREGPWKSDRSLRLVGVDAAAVPNSSDPSFVPGRLQIVGIWRDDMIMVKAQEPIRWPPRIVPEPLFTGAAPAGGWNSSQRSTNVKGLQRLRDTGQIVRDSWLMTRNEALILRVAASDVDAVEAVLAPQLPRRRYVVRSRYTAAQLRDVKDMFAAHYDGWGFEQWSCTNLDAQTQPYAEATLTRVSAHLAAWADTLPDDLLTLSPAMTPA